MPNFSFVIDQAVTPSRAVVISGWKWRNSLGFDEFHGHERWLEVDLECSINLFSTRRQNIAIAFAWTQKKIFWPLIFQTISLSNTEKLVCLSFAPKTFRQIQLKIKKLKSKQKKLQHGTRKSFLNTDYRITVLTKNWASCGCLTT